MKKESVIFIDIFMSMSRRDECRLLKVNGSDSFKIMFLMKVIIIISLYLCLKFLRVYVYLLSRWISPRDGKEMTISIGLSDYSLARGT